MMKMNFQPWGQQVLKLNDMFAINLLGLWLSLGIMAGSVLAGQLYRVGELHATRRYGWLLAAALGRSRRPRLAAEHWTGLSQSGVDCPSSLSPASWRDLF